MARKWGAPSDDILKIPDLAHDNSTQSGKLFKLELVLRRTPCPAFYENVKLFHNICISVLLCCFANCPVQHTHLSNFSYARSWQITSNC